MSIIRENRTDDVHMVVAEPDIAQTVLGLLTVQN